MTPCHRQTLFSPDRAHRYTLWREWPDLFTPNPTYAQFIGLNPSTADELVDDPTVRRCINFAKRWGMGAMCMTNIFAFRATDPRVMFATPEPVGAENDRWLAEIAGGADIVVAAWGTHGVYRGRGAEVSKMLNARLQCLGKTNGGFPRHPLYVAADTSLEDFT
jgi:hypothetical protein